MLDWATHEKQQFQSLESQQRFEIARIKPDELSDPLVLRAALLDFVADFANWDNSTNRAFIATSRALTQCAHESLGGDPGTRPLIVDPFAGGGSIPLEALRIGADAYASDLNPVAVLLNKVVLEYAPKYGQQLADEVRKWGRWIQQEAEAELGKYYPIDGDGAHPIAYMWARTIRCQGPGCGTELPLIGQVWVSKKKGRAKVLHVGKADKSDHVDVSLVSPSQSSKAVHPAVSRKSSATCPLCGYTTEAKRVRQLLSEVKGGTDTARLIAVVVKSQKTGKKEFRLPTRIDLRAVRNARLRAQAMDGEATKGLSVFPDEPTPPEGALGFRVQKYGVRQWRDLYTSRQLVALGSLARLIRSDELRAAVISSTGSEQFTQAVLTCLGLALGRVNDLSSSLCRWLPTLEAVAASNGGQNKMPMILDFVEANPLGGSGGDWTRQVDWIVRVIRNLDASQLKAGAVARSAAQVSPLPANSADALITDPPYYAAFGYSDLSEFFFIWLRRCVPESALGYADAMVPKHDEAISIGKSLSDGRGRKDDQSYLDSMLASFSCARDTVKPSGLGVVVFANKSTAGWETILEALVNSGWIVTASWPVDTERPTRQRAMGAAALQSSVHLVCRPRENTDGSVLTDQVGDWREVQRELPKRIHAWMPRLAAEGVVGADAIFACIGPALEIFSRYSRVERASGEEVTLKEYLEKVWEAVAKEALSMIFEGAETLGFEEDARLTAMWLWTLSTAKGQDDIGSMVTVALNPEEDDESPREKKKLRGYTLEFDAARKIAQGLGAHLEDLDHLVEIKGEFARLLPVDERSRYLFGKEARDESAPKRGRKKQMGLFEEAADPEIEATWGELSASRPGDTALDRVHQAMLLHASNRGAALKRFLVEDAVGSDQRFWRLAQALSALYPQKSDEKRWVDGLLARKKGLGF